MASLPFESNEENIKHLARHEIGSQKRSKSFRIIRSISNRSSAMVRNEPSSWVKPTPEEFRLWFQPCSTKHFQSSPLGVKKHSAVLLNSEDEWKCWKN
jgi:hypothetical protein